MISFLLRGAALLLAVPGLALPGAVQGLDAVTREWTVRRWALDPAAHAGELARAARASDWELRQAAFEALGRAGQGRLAAGQADLARGALRDEHPNVRAAALSASERAGLSLGAGALEAAAQDPWPEVRLALVRYLAPRPDAPRRAELLAGLAADPDPALARAARDALWAGAHFGAGPPADLGSRVRAPEDFVACLSILARGSPDGRWLGALLDAAGHGEPPGRQARQGLVAALGLAAGADLAAGAGLDGLDLARGWLAPLGGDGAAEARARELRLAGAAAAGRRAAAGGAESPFPAADLALELARRAAVADALARGAAPFRGLGLEPRGGAAILLELEHAQRAGVGPAQAAELLLEGALAAAGPEPSRVARVLRGAGEDLAAALWAGAGLVARAWEPAELAHWVTEPGPGLRGRVLEALAQTFARSGDGGAAWGLAFALTDPEPGLRGIAFAALARARDPRPFAEALVESWRLEDPAARLARLRWLPRSQGLHPFRAELVELWESGASREVAVLELLRAFAPDPELAARAGAWLEEHLEAIEAERAEPAGSSVDGPALERETDFEPRGRRPRETLVEGQAKSLVLAFADLAGEGAHAQLAAWLERTAEVSVEVAKTLAAALARGPAGRACLAGWLGPERRARLRVEAALGVLGEGPAHLAPGAGGEREAELAGRALAVLLERMEHCDQPLRARILEALAGYVGWPGVSALLVETALGGRDQAERLQALAALGGEAPRRGAQSGGLREEIEQALAAVLAGSADLDLRRSAIVLLGRSGGPRAAEVLEALARSAPADELEHLDDVLLPARARLEDPPPIEQEVLAAARAAARVELLARFEGRRLAAREFVYRGELAAARHLAEVGRLEAVLAGQAWWELDARLLLLLGERLVEVPDPALRARALDLVRAGVIGLEGEGPAPDREQVRVSALALLARIALSGERPASAAPDLAELLLAWRLGELAPRQLFGPLGPSAPEEGRDPVAWLEASWLQARAHDALERGELDSARDLGRAAAARLGWSERARAQQRRLDALLE